MTEERKGQIALLVLKEKTRKDGFTISPNMRREIGNIAKKLGITAEEASEFLEIMVRSLVDEAFAKSSKRE